MTAELIKQALCVFDWQVAPEFSFDGRSHIQFQLMWSLPARQTRVRVGVRTRAAAGVILSLLSQEQNEYLRLEVSHGSWSTPPPHLYNFDCLVCAPEWWLEPDNNCRRCLSGWEWVILGLETYGWLHRGLVIGICMFSTRSFNKAAKCCYWEAAFIVKKMSSFVQGYCLWLMFQAEFSVSRKRLCALQLEGTLLLSEG